MEVYIDNQRIFVIAYKNPPSQLGWCGWSKLQLIARRLVNHGFKKSSNLKKGA
jgi:hypothetical protein